MVRGPRWYDGLDLGEPFSLLDEGFGGFVMVVLFIIAVVIAILFVLPAFVFLVEVLLVGVLIVGAIAMRVLFRQPWLVDAVADDGTHLAWKVVGYRKSRRVVDEVASLLAKGVVEPQVADGELVRSA